MKSKIPVWAWKILAALAFALPKVNLRRKKTPPTKAEIRDQAAEARRKIGE